MLIFTTTLAVLVLACLNKANLSTCPTLSPFSCLAEMVQSPSNQAPASLSDELLAVVTAPIPSDPALLRRDPDIEYKQNIQTNSVKLNTLSNNVNGGSSIVRASAACQISRIIFGDRVVTPQSPSYMEEQQENWSQACWLPAACFIKLGNTLEVAFTVKIVTLLQVSFAVRSGGHSASPGFSSVVNSGVLLDLNELGQTTLSSDRTIAHVEPGTTWDKVYEILEKQKLTVVGGRVAGVGVGGLITGGGMSHFSNHWGMVCDNVKNFEVVLASSAVVNANAKENSDLFLALKGGQANFGVVTRFDLHTYPDYQVWYTFRIYAASDKDAVMKASIKVPTAMESNPRIGFFLTVTDSSFTAGMVHRGHTKLPSEFRVFDGITPLLTAVPETNGTALSIAIAAAAPGLAKRETGIASIKMDAKLYSDLQTVLQDITNTTSYQLAFTYQPLGAPSVKKSQEKGGNSLNIAPVNQNWLGFIAQWTDAKDDNLARGQIRELISKVKSTAKARGLLLDFDFMSDASYTQSPLKSYGTSSLAALNAASRKYDPKGVFQKLQNSGFLLSKV